MTKHYGALGVIAGIMKFIGWAIIAIACLSFALTMFAYFSQPHFNSQYGGYVSPVMVIIASAFISLLVFLGGVVFLASGELIEAVVDIAVNTAHLPTMANNSDRTVDFFTHMSNRANGGVRERGVQAGTPIS